MIGPHCYFTSLLLVDLRLYTCSIVRVIQRKYLSALQGSGASIPLETYVRAKDCVVWAKPGTILTIPGQALARPRHDVSAQIQRGE